MSEQRNWWRVISNDGSVFCAVVSDVKPPEGDDMKIEDGHGGVALLTPGTFRVLDDPLTESEAVRWMDGVLRGTGQDVDLDSAAADEILQ